MESPAPLDREKPWNQYCTSTSEKNTTMSPSDDLVVRSISGHCDKPDASDILLPIKASSASNELDFERPNTHSAGPQSISPGTFFRFPPEIRVMIYELCLIHDDRSMHVQNPSTDISFVLKPSARALIYTCRQAYREGSNLLNRRNRFKLYNIMGLCQFLTALQPDYIQSILEFCVTINRQEISHMAWDITLRSLDTARRFINLRTIRLNIAVTSTMCDEPYMSHVLHSLYELRKVLKHLVKVVLTQEIPIWYFPWYAPHRRDFENTLGWAYSAYIAVTFFDPQPILRDAKVKFIEILELVHGPFWPEGSRNAQEIVYPKLHFLSRKKVRLNRILNECMYYLR